MKDEALALIAIGLRAATDDGIDDPKVSDGIWALLTESAETLGRLPDREIGWLKSGARAHHPDIVKEFSDEFANAVAMGGKWEEVKVRPGPPSAAAVGRLAITMTWLRFVRTKNSKRDRAIVYWLASGMKPGRIARRYGVHRNTVYNLKAVALRQIEAALLRGAVSL